ncbi:MAG: exodeoxyribonuclease VII small subunit [Ruminococcaceae bacterium]|nr:exodeoxyribonuclease VII small subunit [Oscillospiraceae bacterium]
MPETNQNNSASFETKLQRLEAVVKALEDSSTALDDSLKLFEEGVGLVRECSKMLDDAQKKVKRLTRNENGEIVEEDMD